MKYLQKSFSFSLSGGKQWEENYEEIFRKKTRDNLEEYVSNCCQAKVEFRGIPDFIGQKDICTITGYCLECRKPCDFSRGGKRE